MATARLVPSAYTLSSSNTSYISITNPSNMYKNTDTSSSYATLKGRNSNSTYYLYIHGFNFDDIPSNATVTSFSVKIRAYGTNVSTRSSYRMSLYHSTTAISSTTVTSSISTSVQVFTFPIPSSLTWSTIAGYGNTFRIRVPIRRSSSTPYIYISGAEIEVNYTVPNPRTITSSLTGNGTISPSGANTYYDGDTYTLTITPSVSGAIVSATKDGSDITSSLVNHTTYYTYAYTVSGNATIAVTIVDPVAATVTSTLTGYGTISPSGATSTYEGLSYTLTITPDESTYTVTATKNNVDITSSLVNHTTYYTYTYIVDGNATIAVVITRPAKLWVKINEGSETLLGTLYRHESD